MDIAAQYGRRSIALGPTQYRKRDFATPVIFMRVQDGYLFKRQDEEADKQTGKTVDVIMESVRGKNVVGTIKGNDIQIGDRYYSSN